MSKKGCIYVNVLLLIWFSLDMVGFKVGNFILVEGAFKEDGMFFIIYFVVFIIFLIKDKIGKYFLIIWLLMWYFVQYINHLNYTIFGVSVKKLESYNEYFANTYHILPASDRILVPDLYHILLQLIIGIALVYTIGFCLKNNAKTKVERRQ